MLRNIYAIHELLNLLEIDTSCCLFFGGTVRDGLLGRNGADYDLLLGLDLDLSTLKAQMRRIPDVRLILEKDEFNYVKILYLSRSGIIIDFQIARNIESFLRKRDFTINSLAVSFHNALRFFASKNTDCLIDLNNGLRDLKKSTLKPCSQTSFSEDPIRIIRACYMLCSFELRAHPLLFEMAREEAFLLEKLNPNRLWNEFTKFFYQNPVRFLRVFSHLDLDLAFLGRKFSSEEIEAVARIESLLKISQKKKERKVLKAALLYAAGIHNLWFIVPFIPKRLSKAAQNFAVRLQGLKVNS